MALDRLQNVDSISQIGAVQLASRGSRLYVVDSNSRVAQSLFDDPYDLVRNLADFTPENIRTSPTSTNAGVVKPIPVPNWACYCDFFHLYSGVNDPTTAPVGRAFGWIANPGGPGAASPALRGIHADYDSTTYAEGDTAGTHEGLWIPLEDPRVGTLDLTFPAAYAARNSAIGSGWRMSQRQSVYVYGAQSILFALKTAAAFSVAPTSSFIVARFST